MTSNLVKAPEVGQIGLFTQEQTRLIKKTIMSGKIEPSDNDLALFGLICQRAGLDPFSKQIYAIERAGKWTFQISIDGLRAIADRSGQYAGSDEPLFDEGLDGFAFEQTGRKAPTLCKVTVYKIVQGVRCPFTAVVRWSDYAKTAQKNPIWGEMPLHMLSIRAEAHALRKAFPQVQQIQSSVAIEGDPIVEEGEIIDSHFINDQQYRVIRSTMTERGVSTNTYVHWLQQTYGTDRTSEVPASEFPNILKAIEQMSVPAPVA
jgi:phage recombination protein Bet